MINDRGNVSITLKESQRVLVVKCGFAVLTAAVAFGFFVRSSDSYRRHQWPSGPTG
jgi:hypothetical protein